MNIFGLILVVIGILYLTYSFIFRNVTTIYFKNMKISKGKEDEYLKLQLYFSILNSLILIIIGSVILVYNSKSPFILLVPLLFHIVNSTMKKASKRKGYIEF